MKVSVLQWILSTLVIIGSLVGSGIGEEESDKSIEQERLDVMREHAQQMRFRSNIAGFPKSLVDQPLFRYDDQARGYVDGTVWRLGTAGRPKAIITTELHPKYYGEPRIVCDYLSLTDAPFRAAVAESATWTPSVSAVEMKPLSDVPKLAETKPQRLVQLKKVSERFHAHQSVEGQELELRLLPRPIDRYQPSERADSDAAIFVFVSGRNPGVLLVIEASDDGWQYGVGRLSGPSALTLTSDNQEVWRVSPAIYEWHAPYTAANFPIVIPGY